MPFPEPAVARNHLHTRTVTCQGYEREDGLFEVDGWMTDVKTYSFKNRDRGEITPGEPLHGMGIRITYDDKMTIVDAVAAMDYSPFRMCPDITPNFKALIGMRMVPGFTRAVKEKFGGVKGCTHLVELMGPIATTAFQTMTSKRFAHFEGKDLSKLKTKPMTLDTCHSWSTSGPNVKREFPQFYVEKKAEAEKT